jgi:hypothetical protein
MDVMQRLKDLQDILDFNSEAEARNPGGLRRGFADHGPRATNAATI